MRIEKMMNDLDLNDQLFVPLEIMFEILTWLPVMSLLRFKCVCKRWNQIIQHPKFIQMNMIRSNKKSIYSASKHESFSTILDTCYGLLLEQDTFRRKYRVRNPATKQILALPDPKEHGVLMAIVFLASTNTYKLVYIYEREGEVGGSGFKALSFEGSDLSWRALKNPYFCKIDWFGQTTSVKFQGRFLYFVELHEDGPCDSQVHCLNMETEILRDSPIIVPHNFFYNWENVEFRIWDENVAFMNIVEEDLHVWVLEDPIRGKWADKKIIIPLTFLKVNPSMKEMIVPHWASREEIWFFFTEDDARFITYYTRSKQAYESQYIVPHGKTVMWNEGCTLVKLKGMKPEKNQKSDDVVKEITVKRVKLVPITKKNRMLRKIMKILNCLLVCKRE